MTESLIGARRTVLVALISVTSLLFAGEASVARSADLGASPPDEVITAEVVTVNGSGCKPGTAKVVAPDKTSFRIQYRNYTAKVGPDVNSTYFRRNCQIVVRVHIPQGFTFAIARAEYRGYAWLQAGATAQQNALYYWQGDSDTARSAEKSFAGPMTSTWNNIDVTPVVELVYARCGETRDLNIDTDLRVYAGSSNPNLSSAISMNSASGDIDTIYHVDWKKC
jgi:hypothetical protein